MMRRLLLSTLGLLALAACGGPQDSVATFTSDVVQRETCRVVGEGRESCTREEVTLRLRVTLIEDALDRVWMTGINREGNPDRAILGTRDSEDGYLFEDEQTQTNANSGCVLTDHILLSLRVPDEVDASQVGLDDCLPLVGRETRTTTTSPECDQVNDPPQRIQRIQRRRWQEAAGCEGASAETP
jgi:hypothetical protein